LDVVRNRAQIATANPMPTQAAAGTGMLRVRASAAWASMSTASQPYPTVIRTIAASSPRQKRRAARSRSQLRAMCRTAAAATSPFIGTNMYASASVPAPMVR